MSQLSTRPRAQGRRDHIVLVFRSPKRCHLLTHHHVHACLSWSWSAVINRTLCPVCVASPVAGECRSGRFPRRGAGGVTRGGRFRRHVVDAVLFRKRPRGDQPYPPQTGHFPTPRGRSGRFPKRGQGGSALIPPPFISRRPRGRSGQLPIKNNVTKVHVARSTDAVSSTG